MSIQQFELFHGAVLAKLVRSDKPITLRMIETKDNAWSVYTINDEVELFIKVRAKGTELTREKDGFSWQFVFTHEQLEQIKNLRNSKSVALALVCGQNNIKEKMEIAFIEPNYVEKLIGSSTSTPFSLTVKDVPRKKFRIITNYTVEMLISKNALEAWCVPGT